MRLTFRAMFVLLFLGAGCNAGADDTISGQALGKGKRCNDRQSLVLRETLRQFVNTEWLEETVAATQVLSNQPMPWTDLEHTLDLFGDFIETPPSGWKGWPGSVRRSELWALLIVGAGDSTLPSLARFSGSPEGLYQTPRQPLTENQLKALMGLVWLSRYRKETPNASADTLRNDLQKPSLSSAPELWASTSVLGTLDDIPVASVSAAEMLARTNNGSFDIAFAAAIEMVKAHRRANPHTLPNTISYPELFSQISKIDPSPHRVYSLPSTAAAILSVVAERLTTQFNVEIGVAMRKPGAGSPAVNDAISLIFGDSRAIHIPSESDSIAHSHPYLLSPDGALLISRGLSAGIGYDFFNNTLNVSGCTSGQSGQPSETSAASDLCYLYHNDRLNRMTLIIPGEGLVPINVDWGNQVPMSTPFGIAEVTLPSR